jgi:hypothetical protein
LEKMAQGNKEFFDDLVDHAGVKALETTVGPGAAGHLP